MIDPFGRSITYLRVSVTDRCDLRCVYCMAEDMTFLPKRGPADAGGTGPHLCGLHPPRHEKIRITGGEPLVRRDVMHAVRARSARPTRQRAGRADRHHQRHAACPLRRRACATAGVRRINVSLDTLDPATFTAITRWGQIEQTLDGIFAAKAAGLAVKINAVAMKGVNEDEFDGMLAWCGEHGFDLCLIETMPMGDIDRRPRPTNTCRCRWSAPPARALDAERDRLPDRRPGALFRRAETGRRIGFITPMTHNFCESCNRVRLTCTGTLYMCLGQDDAADLRARAARRRRRRRAGRRDPRGDRAQAQGPRLHHRPPPRAPGGGAAT